MSWQYGELWPTNGWDRLASLGYPSICQWVSRLGFITARRHSAEINQILLTTFNRGCHLYLTGQQSRSALAHILVGKGFYSPDAFPVTEETVSERWRCMCSIQLLVILGSLWEKWLWQKNTFSSLTLLGVRRSITAVISLCFHSITEVQTVIFQPLYRSACVNHHLQWRTRGFYWSKVLLPACPCWWQLMHLDWGEDAWVLLSSVAYTISVLQHYRSTVTGPLCGITDWSVCYVVVIAVDMVWCVVWSERQQQQSLEIERYKRDWQHERDAADKLRQQLHQLQVSYLYLIISFTWCLPLQ